MFTEIPGGTFEIINKLKCWIPKKPAAYLIDGFDKPKKDQKFIHTPLPEQWEEWREEEAFQLELDSEYTHPKIEEFKKQEWTKRLEGYWFFNRGIITYITGKHYFYVNWWKLDSGLPEYRDTDRRLFYFWQYCIEDSKCYGMVEMTMRRQGKTYRGACEMYEELSRPPQKISGGVQSKTGADAAELFEEKLIEPWKDLPDFFKPESNSGTDPKKVLRFARDITKGRKAKSIKQNADEELRNFIDWKPAKEKAYDGKAKKRMFFDECGKTSSTDEADVYKRHKVIKPCLVKNGEIWGKAYLSTTVEELTEGGAEFKKIWDESDPNKKDENGETESGLYRYFLSALEGTFYDEYGFSDVEKARKKYDATRKALKDKPNDLASQMRKFPYDEDEPFMADGDNCEFNAFVLSKRLQELELKEPVTVGDFEWTNGIDTDVRFIPNPNGKFKVAWLPFDQKEMNLVEKGPIRYKEDGTSIQTWRPLNDLKFRLGVDPVELGISTVEKRVSDTAMYVKRLFDASVDDPNAIYTEENCEGWDYKIGKAKWKTNKYIVEYIARNDDPVDSFEHCIKVIRFFGCSVFPETNKPMLKQHLINRGYGDFIKWRPKDTWTNDSGSQNTPGANSSTPLQQQFLQLNKSYVNSYGHLIPFKSQVKDLIAFRKNKITEHDATVAMGFTEMACLGDAKVVQQPIDVTDLFNTYKINGSTTELVR